jgi:hypothetical protein
MWGANRAVYKWDGSKGKGRDGHPASPRPIRIFVISYRIWQRPRETPSRHGAMARDRAELVGFELWAVHHPETDVVDVEARPQDACATERVGGGT